MPEPISKGFQKQSKDFFFDSLEVATKDALHKKFCMLSTSTSASETYEWLAGLPGMKEWLDERQFESLKKHEYTINNRQWEAGLAFWNYELEDNPSVVKDRIPGLVESAAEHPIELILEMSVKGETEKCYDEEPFFSAAHPSYLEGETFSNIISQTGTTVDNIKADFDSIVLAAISHRKTNGHSLFAVGSLEISILHPVALQANMEKVFDKKYLPGSDPEDPNDYYGKASHYPAAFLTGTTWYAYIINKAFKPLVFQERQKLKAEWDLTQKFMKNKSFFGVDARYNVGYGLPQLGYIVKP